MTIKVKSGFMQDCEIGIAAGEIIKLTNELDVDRIIEMLTKLNKFAEDESNEEESKEETNHWVEGPTMRDLGKNWTYNKK